MDLSDTSTAVTVLAAIALIVGIVGVVVPVLPGLVLCLVGVAVWAIFSDGSWVRWLVLGLAALLVTGGTVAKYAWPGRHLARSRVPNRSLMVGGVLAIVGFFVIPVVGLVIGFILGVWVAEAQRLGGFATAWPSTVIALKAAGLSMLIELLAAVGVLAVWIIGVAVS
jgi:uncharacterized protein YqgC (DUF456 family)